MAPSGSPIRPRSRAAALLVLGLLLPACAGSCGGGGTTPGTTPPPAETPLDPAVTAALAKRPDLARTKVIVLGMDGLDPDLMRILAEAGRLPNFRRLVEEGAAGPIRTQQPTLSPLLWTSVATGKFPTEHQVLDFMVRDESDPSKRTTVTSRHRQVEAMWDVAGRYGRTVGLVGWLASHPAERVNGFAVSERTEPLAYLYREKPLTTDEGKTWPPDLMGKVKSLRRPPADVPFAEVAPFLDVTEQEFRSLCTNEEFTDENRVNDVRLVYAAAENFRRVGTALFREKRPDLFCLYLEELDAISHFCMAYREPVTWKALGAEEIRKRLPPGIRPGLVDDVLRKMAGGDPDAAPIQVAKEEMEAVAMIRELARGADPDRIRRLGKAVDAAYGHSDRILGEVMGLMDAETVLVVVSDHGFASGPGKPPFDSSFRSRLGGANYHRNDGFLAFFGKGVKMGSRFPRYGPPKEGKPPEGARLVDVCPTVLALMGFPKAQDMPGRVLAEIFTLDLGTGTVPTFESGRAERIARERMERSESRRAAGGADPVEEDALDAAMQNLIAVGYVGTEEEGPVRAILHMAASYLEQGRWEEAEEAFREALKSAEGPRKVGILCQLGRILTFRRGPEDPGEALRRRRAEAEGYFRQALSERPSATAAKVGLAELLEVREDLRGALDLWEQAVREQPENPVLRMRLGDCLRRVVVAGPAEGRAAGLGRAVALLRESSIPGEGEGTDENPLEAIRRNFLGMALLEAGQMQEAIGELRKAAEFDGKYVRPRNNLGVASLRLASMAFLAAEAAGGEDRERLLAAAGKHREEALGWFDAALAIDPENAKARYNRAEIFALLPPKDLAAAEREAALALKADPEYRKARKLLEQVRAGRTGPAPEER